MALSKQPFFDEGDTLQFRLIKLNEIVNQKYLHQVLVWGTSDKDPSETFIDYVKRKNDPAKPVGRFKDALNKEQKDHLRRDLTGYTYDVSLIFVCIRFANAGLAPSSDNATWKKGNGNLESLISSAKDCRNEVMHGQLKLDKPGFSQKVIQLRTVLVDMLTGAGQAYNISQVTVDQVIQEMHDKINYVTNSSLVPQNYADYKKLSLFVEHRSHVCQEGKKLLDALYDDWDYVTPVSKMMGAKLKANNVYSNMVILDEKDARKIPLQYEDILQDNNQDKDDPILLVEGVTGIGKSTLAKKIMADWKNGITQMNKLTSYELLLYVECRNPYIKSFKELLQSLMPDLCKESMEDDIVNIIMDMNTLVIVDGIDEINDASTQLVNELIHRKKDFGLTLLVTTRPERVESFYNLVASLKIKHIHLDGIDEKVIEEFVTKYHEELKRNGINCEDLTNILQYLEMTKHSLGHVWRLPYNLSLLCISWNMKPAEVKIITTAIELHWLIHQLSIDKLIERLQRHPKTRHLSVSVLKEKVKDFIFRLSKEALISLQHDALNLSDESVQRLHDVCADKELPPEEMTSSFLNEVVIRTKIVWKTKLSFPHKGAMDFYASLSIWMISKGDNMCLEREKKTKEIQSALNGLNLPAIDHQEMMVTWNKLRKMAVTNIRNLITDDKVSQSLNKYQNVLINLLGLFYIDSKNVNESAKMEVLKLLEESGITGSDQWLNVLNSVNCDNFVLTYISKVPNIMKDKVEIRNTNVFAYNSIFKAVKPEKIWLNITGDPSKIPGMKELLCFIKGQKIKVGVDIRDDNVKWFSEELKKEDIYAVDISLDQDTTSVPDFSEFIINVVHCKSDVRRLRLRYHFEYPSSNFHLGNILEHLDTMHGGGIYTGPVTVSTTFDTSKIWKLNASVADSSSYDNLCRIVSQADNLLHLSVCFPLTIDPDSLRPLPSAKSHNIYLHDVQDDSTIDVAVRIVHRVIPTDGGAVVTRFPRANLDVTQQERLQHGLKGFITRIVLPESCRPSEEDQRKLSGIEWCTKEKMMVTAITWLEDKFLLRSGNEMFKFPHTLVEDLKGAYRDFMI